MNTRSTDNQKLSSFKQCDLSSNKDEIDLIELVFIAFKSFKLIFFTTIIFIIFGVFITVLSPKQWISSAVVSPISDNQLQPLDSFESALSVLGIELDITSEDMFTEFRKSFSSQNVFDTYLSSSKIESVGSMGIGLLVPDRLAPNFYENKNNYVLTYSSNHDSGLKEGLTNYIGYVDAQVIDYFNKKIKLTIDTYKKTANDEYQLALQQIKNEQKIRIQQLENAISVAKAAGLQKPVGNAFDAQSGSNNPYPISWGYDALSRQLEIEKSITDPAIVNINLLNKKLFLDKISALKPIVLDIHSFDYLQQSSEPVQQSNKRRLQIIILFGFVGLLGSFTFVLVRHYIRQRQSSLLDLPKE
ncbi:Wzz/FepE/Etk N-terminal domain-containing protein [Yersinia sp. LJYL362]|uniref:Wzz/FepE/Etk N-terminal domain-containing protein n=1 Tax=Yersinia sp. LJYL362 TaxID=3402108 RepID=UPI003AB7C566